MDTLYTENTEPHLGRIFIDDLCLRTNIDEISNSIYVSQYLSVFSISMRLPYRFFICNSFINIIVLPMYLHSPWTDAFIVSVMCDMDIGKEQCRELETFGNPRQLVEIVSPFTHEPLLNSR